MTVDECLIAFTRLAQYFLDLVSTEEKKVWKFQKGLCEDFEGRIASVCYIRMGDVVLAANEHKSSMKEGSRRGQPGVHLSLSRDHRRSRTISLFLHHCLILIVEDSSRLKIKPLTRTTRDLRLKHSRLKTLIGLPHKTFKIHWRFFYPGHGKWSKKDGCFICGHANHGARACPRVQKNISQSVNGPPQQQGFRSPQQQGFWPQAP